MAEHDREPGVSPGEPDHGSSDPVAGAANTPPFEGSDPYGGDRQEARPPSHREHLGEPSRTEEEGLEAIAPAGERQGEGSSTLGESADRIRDRAADAIDAAADRVGGGEGGWDDEGDLRRTASRWADRAADARDEAAEYLHNAGVDDLRALVERQVRERPLQSLLLAAATGWLVGKILR